jgi:serine/threonine protein kinase
MPETLGLAGFDEVAVIGRGGFGVVYRARQMDFDRLVAVKVLPGVFDDRARSRFDRERRALGALSSHPNIVQVHSSGLTDDGYPYLVMEFAPGGSLGERIGRDGHLPWAEGATVGAKLADALGVAHDRGVLHRDVKPENVLFSEFGEPMLADFGIAQIAGQTATRTGIVTATLEHAAPEVLQGGRPGQASDQYALASTLFAAIAGRAPFVREDDESFIPLITRTATEPPPDLRSRGVPDGVCATLERGLAKDPDERYPSVRDFGAALRDAVSEQSGPPVASPPPPPVSAASRVVPTPPPPPNSPPPPSPPDATRRVDAPVPPEPGSSARRRIPPRILVAALGGVVVVVAVVVGIFVFSSGSSSGPAPVSGTLLFDSSLAKSSGVRFTSPQFNGSGSVSFTGSQVTITSHDPNGIYEALPDFHASGSQLASIRAAVDISIPDGQTQAGLAWRNQSDGSRYVFLIDRGGSFQIFKDSGGTGTQLLTGSVDASDHYRLQIEGSGPDTPGANDTVNLVFQIDTNSMAVTDQSGALPTGPVGMEVDGAGSAAFSNLSVAHK